MNSLSLSLSYTHTHTHTRRLKFIPAALELGAADCNYMCYKTALKCARVTRGREGISSGREPDILPDCIDTPAMHCVLATCFSSFVLFLFFFIAVCSCVLDSKVVILIAALCCLSFAKCKMDSVIKCQKAASVIVSELAAV